jgi:eukaryotic-like serine/threonine-protein kinase
MTDRTEPTLIHGRYLLQERIARGGSADVWRARDEELHRPVAVKLLHPHLVPDETARRRLAAEGRLAASLTHPGIVQVYAVLPDGEAPALVMELIDGESLDVRLARDGAVAPRVAASIGADVAEALAEAHRQGIIHRDVKPSNILIDPEGRAHLGDFGIAHSLAPDIERLTLMGTVVGTLAYIAPEQLAGGEVGPRTDLYGLGAVLFEMLTGHPPFDATSQLVLAEAQAAGPPAIPGVDPALAEITRACLAIAPADRPPDASQVAAILRAIPTMNPAEREADTRAIPVAVPPPAPPEEMPLTRWWHRALPIAFGAAGLFVAVLLVAAMLGPGKPAEGAGATSPTSTPTPAWMATLMSDYATACGATLDPATLAGLSRSEAEDRVNTLMDECATSPGSSGGGGPGKGKGHGKP